MFFFSFFSRFFRFFPVFRKKIQLKSPQRSRPARGVPSGPDQPEESPEVQTSQGSLQAEHHSAPASRDNRPGSRPARGVYRQNLFWKTGKSGKNGKNIENSFVLQGFFIICSFFPFFSVKKTEKTEHIVKIPLFYKVFSIFFSFFPFFPFFRKEIQLKSPQISN